MSSLDGWKRPAGRTTLFQELGELFFLEREGVREVAEGNFHAHSQKMKGAFARRFDMFAFKNPSDVIQERLICLVPFGCGSYRSAFDRGPRCNGGFNGLTPQDEGGCHYGSFTGQEKHN